MIDYIFKKICDDYALVSLDYSLGTFMTNLSLVCNLWVRRLYLHMINNEYKFNKNNFINNNP